MRRRIKKLSSQIFLAQLVILVVSTAVGFGLVAMTARQHLDESYQQRAAAIAQTFAEMPEVQTCLAQGGTDCPTSIQDLATAAAQRTGAAFVVVIDANRVRHSHPNPSLIGKQVSEALLAADGRIHLRIDNGATGPTANAIVPLYAVNGGFIGEVSAGIHEESVSSALLEQLPSYAIWFAVMLLLAAAASIALATWLKRRTFGLELDEIARLLQEREATLHGIREGVVAVEPDGRISVVNDEAHRLLGLPNNAAGHHVADVIPAGAVREALMGASTITDEIVVTDDYWLVLNRMPVVLGGRPHGVVVTVQDRTVVEGLIRELDGERSLAESMRAQHHEFANRLHGIAGLLELGRATEALDYVNEIRGTSADLDRTLREHVAAPLILGLLLGKAAEAGEQGIELVIAPETKLGESPDRVQTLATILGNLIDNAFDALVAAPQPKRVTIAITEDDEQIRVAVTDTGPGVAGKEASRIFRPGYTTKRGASPRHYGLGLSLVRRAASQLNGTVSVSRGPGATFQVTLPRRAVLAEQHD